MRRLTLILILLTSLRVFAQQNAVYLYPSVYYQRGLELYDEKKFNAAITQFNLFLEKSDNDGQRSDAEYYLAVCKLYAEHSDGEAALVRFLEKNPGSHKTHMANLALGDYYYLKRKYSSALTYYKQVDPSAISPDERDRFFFRKGYSQVERKKYKDAAETLRPLTEKENDYKVLATYYYAYCAYYTGDYREALRAFKAIEDDGPKMVRLYVGQIYYMNGDYEKAISYLDKFASGVPKSQLNLVKGKCYYRMGQFEKAADYFNKTGLTRDSLDKNEIYEMGFANYKTGNYSKAADWFKLISYQGDSMSQFASYNLADCNLKLKNKRDAMNGFAEAYRTGLNKSVAEDALFNQAKLAVELNESNAASLLQKYVDNYPKSANSKEAKKLLAKLMLNTDNYKDAVAVLESIGDLDEQTEESYQRVTLARGMELFKSRQWNEAIAMFDKCMAKKASRKLAGQAAFWKAESQMQQEKFTEAGQNYQKFLDADGTEKLDYYNYVFYGLGYVNYKDQDYSKASQYFEKYVNNATRGAYNEKVYSDAQLRLGDCFFVLAGKEDITKPEQTKLLEKAIKGYAYVTGKRGADADYAQFQTGMIYGLQSQGEKKISSMKRLVADYPKSRFIPDAYFELGSEYVALKNNREAEKYFMYVIDDFKGNALVGKSYAILGRMYYNAGQDDKAVDMYTKLYKEYPGTTEAKGAADQVKRIYVENGRPGDYDRWLKNMGGSMPASERDSTYYEVAYTYYTKGEYKNAVNAFKTYLQEMQNGAFVISAHYYKAVSHQELKQNADAIEDYKIVADANGSEFQEDAVLNILDLSGPNASCEQLVPYLDKIEKLTKSRETRYRAWGELLHCYQKMNKTTEAREIARKIGDELSAPEDLKGEALVYEGVLFYNEKNYSQALIKFEDAYTRFNNKYAAEAKYREGLVYFAQNNYDATDKSCNDVLNKYSSYDIWVGKAMLLLGDAYLAKGEEANAKATWNSVIDNFDTPELVNEAKEKLARLKNKTIKTNNVIED